MFNTFVYFFQGLTGPKGEIGPPVSIVRNHSKICVYSNDKYTWVSKIDFTFFGRNNFITKQAVGFFQNKVYFQILLKNISFRFVS